MGWYFIRPPFEHPRVDTSLLCPSDESLAAFVDGMLDNLSAMYVDEHLSCCHRCYEIVSETRAALKAVQAKVREEYREKYREEYERWLDRTHDD